MNPCLLLRSPQDLGFSLPLRPLIADWETATPKFISGLTARLQGFTDLRSADWEVTDSGVLRDRACRCRLFGGAATITLRPDEITLDFSNVVRQAHAVIFEILGRTLDLMNTEFPDHPYDSCNLTCTQHADVSSSDSADSYLSQFSYAGTSLTIANSPQLQYEPSIRIVLSSDDGMYRTQRVVEKSGARDGALFVFTSLLLDRRMTSSHDTTQMTQFFDEACERADQAIGLVWRLQSNDVAEYRVPILITRRGVTLHPDRTTNPGAAAGTRCHTGGVSLSFSRLSANPRRTGSSDAAGALASRRGRRAGRNRRPS